MSDLTDRPGMILDGLQSVNYSDFRDAMPVEKDAVKQPDFSLLNDLLHLWIGAADDEIIHA